MNAVKSLGTKVKKISVLLIVLAVFLTTAVALIASVIMINNIAQNEARASMDVLNEKLSGIGKTLQTNAQTISFNESVINFVEKNDSESLLNALTKLSEALDVETVTVTDSNGIVIMRAHDPEEFGDDLSYQSNVKTALSGQVNSDIETGTTVKYAVKAGAPINDEDGNIIGAVTVGYQLDNTDFVDSVKKTTGNEITIFVGDERFNTTIMNNGERVVGTKLDSKIADEVINNKQQYMGKAKIFGHNYITVYSPIISKDGTIVTGILFSGMDMKNIQNQIILVITIICLIATFIALFSFIIMSGFLKKNLKQPLENIVSAANELALGNIDVNVKAENNDEIGQLAESFEYMITSIRDQAEAVVSISNGDLTIEYIPHSEKDVMGNALVRTVNGLREIFEAISISVSQVNSGAEQVAVGAQSLSETATEQASSIEELSIIINDVSAQVSDNAESAAKAKDLFIKVGSEVSNGNEQMNKMIDAMNGINSSSAEISKIIKVIDDIAFQTNILALNAAVEAARAGSAGKGFAVVADEVRNLAAKSAAAAKNTTVLIEDSISRVSDGAKIADSTAGSLKVIVQSINEVSEIIKQIDNASESQAASLDQVTLGMEQISAVVQTTSATAEESAAASEELSGQSNMLEGMISNIKLNSTNNN